MIPAVIIAALALTYAPATPLPAATPSASPAPVPAATSTPRSANRASMTMPKGWVPGITDSVAKFVYRSPSAPQDIRVAPIRPNSGFSGEAGMQKVRDMLARFPFAHTDVSGTTVCDGKQPAILAVAQNAQNQTVMEQIVVVGATGGAIVTYEISDGKPDPSAESALHSICIP